MANRKAKCKKKKKRNGTYDKSSNSTSNNYTEMSEVDIESLKLLYLQIPILMILIYAYLLLYKAATEGIQLIYDKYNNKKSDIESPDGLALQAVYIFFVSQIIFTNIAITRYNILYKEKQNGRFDYSLQPNIYIIISNILSIISNIYLINGAEGVYARDNGQDIFGA